MLIPLHVAQAFHKQQVDERLKKALGLPTDVNPLLKHIETMRQRQTHKYGAVVMGDSDC
jgi:hypothetical protein